MVQLPGPLESQWNSPIWRLWAFVHGVVLTALGLALAILLATVFSTDFTPLAFLFTTVILLFVCMAGAGMLDGLWSRISGEPAKTAPEPDTDNDEPTTMLGRRRRGPTHDPVADRRTIRFALMALGPLAAFLYLLWS